MKVSVACDHAGIRFANALKEDIKRYGYELVPTGSNEVFDDYPDAAKVVARLIMEGKTDRGILICGSGAGVSIAANKFPGIKAAVCHDSYTAHQGVEHDRMNVLCLGERVLGEELARELTGIFLAAQPSNEKRHLRRSKEIDAIEKKYLK